MKTMIGTPDRGDDNPKGGDWYKKVDKPSANPAQGSLFDDRKPNKPNKTKSYADRIQPGDPSVGNRPVVQDSWPSPARYHSRQPAPTLIQKDMLDNQQKLWEEARNRQTPDITNSQASPWY